MTQTKESNSDKQSYARLVLHKELERRVNKNHRYSLRQFSKAIGLSPAFLSQFLNEKRLLSNKSLLKVGSALGLSKQDLGTFIEKSKSTQTIHENLFENVADWRTYAVLNLLSSPDFEWHFSYIAKRLKIPSTQAQIVMRNLLATQMIQIENGQAKRIQPAIRFENTYAIIAAQKLQKQFLERAIYSLENDSFETREISSMTFSMTEDCLNYAIEEIRDFRRKLSDKLEKLSHNQPIQNVYNLSVQLVPLTYKETK